MKTLLIVLVAIAAFWATDASTQKKVNFGGTNHWLYAYGTADGNNTGGTWYLPATNIRPPVAHYHLNPSLVASQINALRTSGQNAYVIFLYNSDIGSCEFSSCDDGVPDGTWGEVIDNSWSSMRPQHRANLKSVVGSALDAGFSRIYVRFGYNNSPESWQHWSEKRYSMAWNFIVDARNAAIEAVSSRGLSHMLGHPQYLLMFDLGAEFGGLSGGQLQPFIWRLWADYTYSFGVEDTVGFSFAWAPGRFAVQRDLLQSTGVMPIHWAFDIYDGADSALSSIYSEMGPLRNQPIHFFETYFNDPITASELQTALVQNEFLNVQAIGQWPVVRGTNSGHFTQSAVDALSTPWTFSNYSSALAVRKIHISGTNADILALRDTNCGATTTWPCTVHVKWGSPAPGKHYGIYLRTLLGTALVHCVTAAGQEDVTWISLYPYYVFDVYEVDGWCTHPNPNPGSVKLASAEATPFGY
jgi:hypothetical protein